MELKWTQHSPDEVLDSDFRRHCNVRFLLSFRLTKIRGTESQSSGRLSLQQLIEEIEETKGQAKSLPKVFSIIRSKASSIRRISLEDFNDFQICTNLEQELCLPRLDFLSITDGSDSIPIQIFRDFGSCIAMPVSQVIII